MKKLSVLLFLTLFLSLALIGCGDDEKKEASTDFDYIKSNGVLKVGLDDTFAPMGFRDEEDKLVGFDIDLAKEVAKELGVDIEFVPISWDAKDIELKNKNIDCIWNGMSETPERKEAMSLSKKYIDNKIVLMKLNASKDVSIENESDLAKVKIGTQADSSALGLLNKLDNASDLNIMEYKDYDQAILDLKAGRVDVVAIDQVLGQYKNKNLDGLLEECSYDLGNDFYVVGFRKEDVELTNKVNSAIETLVKNGKAEEISKKWFGKNIVIFGK